MKKKGDRIRVLSKHDRTSNKNAGRRNGGVMSRVSTGTNSKAREGWRRLERNVWNVMHTQKNVRRGLVSKKELKSTVVRTSDGAKVPKNVNNEKIRFQIVLIVENQGAEELSLRETWVRCRGDWQRT